MKQLSKKRIQVFHNKIYAYYTQHRRDFPWRKSITPYKVVVSEIMLQQTQAPRVVSKFNDFTKLFPDFNTLANASFREVLKAWSGLGYNRRAKFLWLLSKQVMDIHDGELPKDVKGLKNLPGIGPHTAGSIVAFAFNIPTVFIETNIRSVFIYEFFDDQTDVDDNDILPLVAQTVDQKCPREWYNALMDYGTFLKQEHGNPNKKSKHHTRQKQFVGSDRQIRGQILQLLTTHDRLSEKQLLQKMDGDSARIKKLLDVLLTEKMINKDNNVYSI